jgi:hypothetical protein
MRKEKLLFLFGCYRSSESETEWDQQATNVRNDKMMNLEILLYRSSLAS